MKKKFVSFIIAALCFTSIQTAVAQLNTPAQLPLIDLEDPELETGLDRQLTSYALNLAKQAVVDKKPVGKYLCEKSLAINIPDFSINYPCELIVHSNEGPIVIRFKNISEEDNAKIEKLINKTKMQSFLYYHNGRFRFSLIETSPQSNSEQENKDSSAK